MQQTCLRVVLSNFDRRKAVRNDITQNLRLALRRSAYDATFQRLRKVRADFFANELREPRSDFNREILQLTDSKSQIRHIPPRQT